MHVIASIVSFLGTTNQKYDFPDQKTDRHHRPNPTKKNSVCDLKNCTEHTKKDIFDELFLEFLDDVGDVTVEGKNQTYDSPHGKR